jgi:hypothetical protein
MLCDCVFTYLDVARGFFGDSPVGNDVYFGMKRPSIVST